MMSKQEGMRRLLHPYLWLTLTFLVIVGILLGRAGTTPASAAASKATMLSSTMNYRYILMADVKGEGDSSFVFIQTDGSYFLHAVRSTDQDLNQRIQDSNNSQPGNLPPGTLSLFTTDPQRHTATVNLPVSQMAVGDTYYQLFDDSNRPISNQIGIHVGEDGTASVICDTAQNHGACDD